MSPELLWTSLSLATRTAGQFLLTVAAVTCWMPETNGLWFNFLSLGGMVQLLDMGLSAAVLRCASHLHTGVQELRAHGVSGALNEEPNLAGLKALLATTRIIYVGLSTAVMVSGVLLAQTVFRSMTDEISRLALVLFMTGSALQLMSSQRYNFMQGVGKLAQAQKLQALGLAIMYGATAIALIVSKSLLWTCATFAVGALIQLVIYEIQLGGYAGGRHDGALLGAFWPNTWRTGLSRLAAAAIYQLPTLIISATAGVVIGGSYGFTVQICLFICAIAQLPLTAVFPKLNELAARGSLSELKRLFFKKTVQMMGIFILLGILLVLWGQGCLTLIHAKAKLQAGAALIGLIAFFFAENNRSNHMYIVGAFNRYPFWKYDLISAAAILIGCGEALHLGGTAGVVLWLWAVQLCWNFWWPIKRSLAELKMTWGEYWGALGGSFSE